MEKTFSEIYSKYEGRLGSSGEAAVTSKGMDSNDKARALQSLDTKGAKVSDTSDVDSHSASRRVTDLPEMSSENLNGVLSFFDLPSSENLPSTLKEKIGRIYKYISERVGPDKERILSELKRLSYELGEPGIGKNTFDQIYEHVSVRSNLGLSRSKGNGVKDIDNSKGRKSTNGNSAGNAGGASRGFSGSVSITISGS